MPGCVWVHACSVGEVGSVAFLVRRLLDEHQRVHLTVVTRTGFAHARRLLGERVSISYLPWDMPGLMRRFVARLRPRMLLLVETEFWPGMLRACARQGVKVVGVNTRISDRSFPRYQATRWFWRRLLAGVHLFLPQGKLDAERLVRIGVDPERIGPAGNLKFAVQPPRVDAQVLRRRLDPSAQRPILLLASTHEDEEARLLRMLPTWLDQCPTLLPVFVPRHPERFARVAELIESHGFRLHRWTEGAVVAAPDVVLLDAMGVLAGLYTVADLVFIGGSLVDVGGHNPLEAAVCGRGVLTGPYVQNFREIMALLTEHEAAIRCANEDEVAATMSRLLSHPQELACLHAAAAEVMQHRRDAVDRVVGCVLAQVGQGG
ncbi:MAG: 3-deoxy-D-manno-octulosonic acid transferase [Zetaproteobacteria bacterium]|nr:MAG: 3-deoxy-D-manno-octulosonic acid transferase [Zetaproteobacteria bacterium]